MEEKHGTAVITGAASGIGRAVALLFAAKGRNLSLIDLDQEGLQAVVREITEDYDVDAKSYCVDICDRDKVEYVFSDIEGNQGRIEALVNCAGIFFGVPFEEMTDNHWNRMLQVNLTSMFIICQVVIRQWIKNNIPGTIVNIGSTSGSSPNIGASHYCVAKAGVLALTRSLALEYAVRGIRVNTVAPGYTRTPLTESEIDEEGQLAAWEKSIPLGRLAIPEEIAKAVEFMISDRASYITGQTLFVDGGYLLDN